MGTIQCARCGEEVNDQAAGCPGCGSDPRSGQIKCVRCGRVVDDGIAFCGGCGAPFPVGTN